MKANSFLIKVCVVSVVNLRDKDFIGIACARIWYATGELRSDCPLPVNLETRVIDLIYAKKDVILRHVGYPHSRRKIQIIDRIK